MTNANEHTDGDNGQALLGVPPQELVNLIGHIASGNLISLLGLTAVCQHLDKFSDGLPEGDPTRKEIRKALAGLGLVGRVLCEQGKQLSDHEDKLVESCEEKSVPITVRQSGNWASAIASDIKAAADLWLEQDSKFRENPNLDNEDADADKPQPKPKPDTRRGGSDFGPNGQRLN
jgi:hypothetical protein